MTVQRFSYKLSVCTVLSFPRKNALFYLIHINNTRQTMIWHNKTNTKPENESNTCTIIHYNVLKVLSINESFYTQSNNTFETKQWGQNDFLPL